MPYDEKLEKRLDKLVSKRNDFYRQKMFGGVGYLLRGNMCFGIWKDSLILRLGETQAQNALKRKSVKPFDITGRAMRGWVMVEPPGMKTDAILHQWVTQAIDFVIQLPSR
ncbi:MAG: TfoX/Sxy family protein [Candidatus Omnitrophica bacterium]|nr:TfoX/Sxy family protein [Candidatus Omnitrophota bacterium]